MSDTYPFEGDLPYILSVVFDPAHAKRDIFFRELLYNAADALIRQRDRHYFADAQPELVIRITPDANSRSLTIEDSGFGMTKDELITFLGCVAKSSNQDCYGLREGRLGTPLFGRFGLVFTLFLSWQTRSRL